MPRVSGGVEFDVQHPSRHDPPFARTHRARILYGVLEVKKDSRGVSGVPLVDEHRPASEQIAMALHRQVERGVEKRMPGTDERRHRHAVGRDETFLERDSFVSRDDHLPMPGQAITITHRSRHVSDLVAARLALPYRAPELLKRLEKERFNVMRLKASSVGALHVLAHSADAAGVHGIVGQRALFEQVFDLLAIHGVSDHLSQPGSYLRRISIADRLDQQFTQRPAVEFEFPEDIEDLTAQSLPRLFQLLE